MSSPARSEEVKVQKAVVTRLEDVSAQSPKPGLRESWIFARQTPTDGLAVVVATIEPGSRSGPHAHDKEEAFYIIGGEGTISLGDQKVEMSPGLFIYVPAGVSHDLACTGSSPLVALAMLSDWKFATTWFEGSDQALPS